MKDYQRKAAIDYKDYLVAAKKFFEKNSSKMVIANHYQHNIEPNYWEYMLQDITQYPNKFRGKLALEYGCGAGRNLLNLLILGSFDRVDGIDISKSNSINSKKFVEQPFGKGRSITVEGDGYTCYPMPDSTYSFVMLHQVFIHIPNHMIRFSIISDIHRVLEDGGVCIIHFKTIDDSVNYKDCHNKFPKNVTPENGLLIKEDFEKIGFKDVTVIEAENYYDCKPEWYVRGVKKS